MITYMINLKDPLPLTTTYGIYCEVSTLHQVDRHHSNASNRPCMPLKTAANVCSNVRVRQRRLCPVPPQHASEVPTLTPADDPTQT